MVPKQGQLRLRVREKAAGSRYAVLHSACLHGLNRTINNFSEFLVRTEELPEYDNQYTALLAAI
jgi:hypothetical protein